MYAVVKGYHSTFLLEIGIYLHSCFFQKVQMGSCNFALWHFYSYQVMIACL